MELQQRSAQDRQHKKPPHERCEGESLTKQQSVLELRVPHGADLASLQPLIWMFLSYVLSFVYLGIYWNNHHHMMHVYLIAIVAAFWQQWVAGMLYVAVALMSLVPVRRMERALASE